MRPLRAALVVLAAFAACGAPPPPPPVIQVSAPRPPAEPVCEPPCTDGMVCAAQGCIADPNAPPPPRPLSAEDQDTMRSTLDRKKRRVLRCVRGQSQRSVEVHVEVEPTGNVVGVRIEGDVASTEAGACIERAVFGIKFAPFEGPNNRTIVHEYTR